MEQELSPSRDHDHSAGDGRLDRAAISNPVLTGWEGIGFILEYDGFSGGDVGFIINVPGGRVGWRDLNAAAAAPEMLAALQAVYWFIERHDDTPTHLAEMVQRALHKAEARTAFGVADGEGRVPSSTTGDNAGPGMPS